MKQSTLAAVLAVIAIRRALFHYSALTALSPFNYIDAAARLRAY